MPTIEDYMGMLQQLGELRSTLMDRRPVDRWIEEVGRGLLAVLREASNPADIVKRWCAGNDIRPTRMQLEQLVELLDAPEDGRVPSGGCDACVGGFRTVKTLRRRANGRLHPNTSQVACDCDRGRAIAQVQPNGVLTWKQAEECLRGQQMVPRMNHQPGLLAWAITDRSCRAWPAELFVDPRCRSDIVSQHQHAQNDEPARRSS